MVKEDQCIKMRNYKLENFKDDIKANREFEFSYHDKMYSLTFSREGYIFTDICGKKDLLYNSYADLLNHTKIEGKKIEEIISENLYDDLSIY